ncbi:MAG: hypothetical protein WCL61_01655 [bacterium]
MNHHRPITRIVSNEKKADLGSEEGTSTIGSRMEKRFSAHNQVHKIPRRHNIPTHVGGPMVHDPIPAYNAMRQTLAGQQPAKKMA